MMAVITAQMAREVAKSRKRKRRQAAIVTLIESVEPNAAVGDQGAELLHSSAAYLTWPVPRRLTQGAIAERFPP